VLGLVPVGVEGSTAGLAAGDVPVDPPPVAVDPPLVSVDPPLVAVDPPLVSVDPPLVPVAADVSVEAGVGLDADPPPVAPPVLVGAGVLEVLAAGSPEAEVEDVGLAVVVGSAAPEEPPDGDALPEPVGLADGVKGVDVPELCVESPEGAAARLPVGELPVLPGAASEPAPAPVVGAELEVDPAEPAGVADGAEIGLPSGVAVTVDGTPVAGVPATGAPAGAVDVTAEAS
jgi:hypothetical protein